MNVIKAIYNFIVGDMIILLGIIITFILLALINNLSPLASFRAATGYILLIGVLTSLTATLYRESIGKRE